jgi:hypothetical protein
VSRRGASWVPSSPRILAPSSPGSAASSHNGITNPPVEDAAVDLHITLSFRRFRCLKRVAIAIGEGANALASAHTVLNHPTQCPLISPQSANGNLALCP